MKYYLLTLCFLFSLTTCVIGQVPPTPQISGKGQGQSAKVHALRVRQEALANPFSEDKMKALMAALPKDEDLYVVEGDLLLTEQELRAYVVVKSQSEKPVDSSAELIVNVHNGQRDYYKDPDQRNLSYAVDLKSFPDQQTYNLAVEHMRRASGDWQAACADCGVQFTHVTAEDNPANRSSSTEKVNFVVRFRDARGAYIAAAFFPHDGPVRRYLNLDPSYFKTSFDKAGVLRHELGHVLGYRHEHTRGVADCFFEDNNWQPLTAYDPKSVMHYFCGGGGSFSLELSDVDKAGHRKLYLTSSATNSLFRKRTVRVRFEGPHIAESPPQVLGTLTKNGLITPKTYTVKVDGERVESIYAAQLQLPLISPSMLTYAKTLNKGKLSKQMKAGQEVLYPDVKFRAYQELVVLNQTDKKDRKTYESIKKTWPANLRSEVRKGPDTIAVVLNSYDLNLQFDSPEKEQKARSALRALKSSSGANYAVFGVTGSNSRTDLVFSLATGKHSTGPFQFLSATVSTPTASPDPNPSPAPARQTAKEFLRLVKDSKAPAGIEGDLSLLLGEVEEIQFPDPCTTNCPEIILIDKKVSLHPDIAAAIKSGGDGVPGVAPINSSTNEQMIKIYEEFHPNQHGTYMAGIIASQPNRFGLIGVNPKAEIHSYKWDDITGQEKVPEFIQMIVDRQRVSFEESKKMQIFVFATEWTFRDSFEEREELRFNSKLQENADLWRDLAKQIANSRPLIIAAAGQSEPNDTPRSFNTLSLEGPRNLGDLQSVIVVTAYEDIVTPNGGRTRQIWPAANFIRDDDVVKLIHVAAPGKDILSTVPNLAAPDSAAFYASASGTSQATAFVAGVVSAMVGAWPSYYIHPFLVKERLQLTSDPFLKRSDAGKLAAGVIDFNLAMHDQSKNWFKKKGDQRFSEVPGLKWLVDKIELLDQAGNPTTVQTKKIYRIMYRDERCYIYAGNSKGELGEIKKFGPGRLKQADLTGLRLFEIRHTPGGESIAYSLSEIEDILLASAK